ncbi:MAG: C25 family cysteine peptidase [candidate division WOR-3 bacterium]|nr:C25 family cysteine peptidase [candidate division WOR-3 bacterium]
MRLKSLSVFILLPGFLFSGVITKELIFDRNELITTKIDGYDLVLFFDKPTTIKKGAPILPVIPFYFVIPPDADVKDVEVVSIEKEELPGSFIPYPGQFIQPFSIDKRSEFVQPDPQIYSSQSPYPDKVIELVPPGVLSGFRIAGINVYPLQYTGASKKLVFYKKLVVRITYDENAMPPARVTSGQVKLFSEIVRSFVINSEMVDFFRPEVQDLRGDEIDYLIITSPALKSNWAPLVNWKTKKGLRTRVLGTDSIYAIYPGRDNQEKIRNCIKDYWQNRGLKYVLLGGDDMIVPDRKTRLVIEESTITGNIPTDMYYADLQWSWDGNNNNLFGEMQDTVDLFFDVFVGRAPVDNATNINTFINKDTIFEKRPDTTYLQKLLLPSTMLFNPYHGRVINNIISSYYPATWRRARLEDPGSNAVRDSLNVGYQLCHVSAHGSTTSMTVLDISHVATLTNGIKYNVMNGINCYCGCFDGGDCIAESLVNYPNGGCVAAILNSRYGLGYPPALGPSEQLDLELFKNFISGKGELGIALAGAKEYLRNLAMSQAPTRWCVYELTLFGDPGLSVYTQKPRTLTVSHLNSITAGPQMFRVTVAISGQPLKNALVCVMKGTEVYSRGRTNSSGWVDLFVNPATSGTMSVTVTAPDCRPYEGSCSVSGSSSQPCILYQSHRIFDQSGNNNGKLDPGETVRLRVMLKNQGNVNATNVSGTLRTSNPFVTLIDSVSYYGSIAINDSAGGDSFIISVSPNTPQGTEVEFIINTTSSQGGWTPFFKDMVGTPPEPRRIWADHDTGACVFTVTTNGSFGTTYPYGEGSGFKYSKLASYGCLYYASMVCGTDPSYIVDRFYGPPASSTINQDFKILDTLKPIIPPLKAHEEYEAWYSDSGHPSPKGLIIKQWSLSLAHTGYDDWVIVCFYYYNRGTNPINNFYSGMMFDFDIYNTVNNIVRSDSVRRFVYMFLSTSSQKPTAGIRILEPLHACNLSAINHSQYVTPSPMMSEIVKDSFLTGKKKVSSGTTSTNWTIIASTGPFNIPAGGYVRVAYAIVGGDDTTSAKINSDSAQSWWNRFVGVEIEKEDGVAGEIKAFDICPNPVSGMFGIRYQLKNKERILINLYDISGRFIEHIYSGELSGNGYLNHRPENLSEGVYLICFEINGKKKWGKIVYVK